MNLSSMPADPMGIAKSLYQINQSWTYNSADLLAMASKLSSSIQAVAAEQLAAVLDNKAPKVKTDDPEAVLMDAVKSCSKLANRLHGVYADWLRAYVTMAPDIPDKERQRSIFWMNQFISAFSPPTSSGPTRRSFRSFSKPEGKAYSKATETGSRTCIGAIT